MDETSSQPLTGEVLAPRPSFAMLRGKPNPDRWLPAVQALLRGASVAAAARASDLSPRQLYESLAREPELLEEVRRHRQALDEINLLRSAALMEQRLDHALEAPQDTDRLSTRDLTDIRRASKPFDAESGAKVIINIDLPV